MNVDWGTIATMAALLTVYSAVILMAVKLLISRQNQALDDRLGELIERDSGFDDDLQSLRRELSDHRIEVARDYVRRNDWVVYFARFERKIDVVHEILNERLNDGR